MNERNIAKNKIKQSQEILQAIIGICILFAVFTFFIFYTKTDLVNTSKEKNLNEKEEVIYSSDILQSYNQKIEAIKDNPDFKNLKINLDENLIKEIEKNTRPPESNFTPFKISEKFDNLKYGKEFIANFKIATTSGMGLEMIYFISQLNTGINNENSNASDILDLSKKDIEDIYKIANVYEDFGNKVQKLETPLNYEQVAKDTIKQSREAAFYLREMMATKDPFLYSYIFNKYLESNKYIFRSPSENTNDLEVLNSDKNILKILQNISSTTKI